MAKQLQIILQDSEYREIQRAARAERMTIAEWVRRALAYTRRQQPEGDVETKIEAAKHESPTSYIGAMLAEIDRG